MFHYIKGKLAMKFENGIVVETGGIGYEICVPGNSSLYLAKTGEAVTVFTIMAVREDDISLYGFAEKESLDTFKKLITVSGVGAKAALAILSAMPTAEVKQAIVFEDPASLAKANGVGKKTAERIILELKDKFGEIDGAVVPAEFSGEADTAGGFADGRSEAVSGLIALGYSKGEAVTALSKIKEKDLAAEEYIKLALKKLF